jgi:hypothetical protein
MEYVVNFFNNREKALIIWGLIVLVLLLVKKDIRPTFLLLLKTLFVSKIATALLIMLAYVSLVVFAAYNVHVWDISLLKDTIMWVLGTAVIMFVNYDKAIKESHFFKKVLLDNVKLVVLLEFIINFYVYNLVVELLLVPVLFIVGALLAYSVPKRNISRSRTCCNSYWLSLAFSLLLMLAYRWLATSKILQQYIT